MDGQRDGRVTIDVEDEEDNISSVIDDPEWTESCERSDIVQKYTMGTSCASEDENPIDDVAQNTDRYGFVHKTQLAPISEATHRRHAVEANRCDKWVHMMFNWSKFRQSEKLCERVAKGIPDRVRSQAWRLMLETSVFDEGAKQFKPTYLPGTYDQLKTRALLCAKDVKQIDLDVNRTYRDNVAFRRRYDHKQVQLMNVLTAYSVYNSDVGYCQGMSQVCAILLMYMDEEDAFWALHALLTDRRHCMHGFFAHGFPKLLRFQDHLENKVLKKYLPRVRKQFQRENVPMIFTTKWYMGCFLDRVPYSLALRIWDMYILYGDPVLVSMSYNIMKMHQKVLRKGTFEEILDVLQNRLVIDFGYDDDTVIDSLQKCMHQLRSDKKIVPAHPSEPHPNEKPTTPFGVKILQRSVADIRANEIRIQSRHTSRAQSMSNYAAAIAGSPRVGRSMEEEEKRLRFVHGVSKKLANVKRASITDSDYSTRRDSPAHTSHIEIDLDQAMRRQNSDYDNVEDNEAGRAFLKYQRNRVYDNRQSSFMTGQTPHIPPPDYDPPPYRHNVYKVTHHSDHVTRIRISPTLEESQSTRTRRRYVKEEGEAWNGQYAGGGHNARESGEGSSSRLARERNTAV